MMVWLSDWLRQILGIVLLAAVIDLLVPGKAYHRYVRLVLGLLILLAMLSPILSLVKGNADELLEAGLRSWEQASSRDIPRMPSLEDIERRAEELRSKRNEQAAELAARTLEGEIEAAAEQVVGGDVADVAVELLVDKDKGPVLKSVTITMAEIRRDKAEEESSGHTGQASEDARSATSGAVQAAEALPVVIEEIDPVQVERGHSGIQESLPAWNNEEKWTQADAETARVIKELVYQRWGVKPEQIVIRMPA
ncbi:stage III sporulation protein AF [Paenibacillus sambharensis]|uniref:Stage III sporulation protein AF n=1 Tax=Paenibacillus sambharensis TaxID=1803190 RepID=A0A2W1LEE9_9BACL|nr:stage III sporulation protein AF [Paenibacillus sambharensis]PZD93432.1 stage III sporulation protein AF [Paenibacillus sambharensis]